jgi:hypothetical protein
MTMIWSSVGLYMVVFSLFGWEKTRRILAIEIYCKKSLAVRSDSGDSGILDAPPISFWKPALLAGFLFLAHYFLGKEFTQIRKDRGESAGLWGSVRENTHGDKEGFSRPSSRRKK